MSKIVLTNTNSGYNLAAINANLQAIADELNNNTLSRANPTGSANQLMVDLDVNGMELFNIDTLSVKDLILNGSSIGTSVSNAANSALASAASAILAGTSANQAAATLATFMTNYLGQFASDPAIGTSNQGALYYNTSTAELKYLRGTTWTSFPVANQVGRAQLVSGTNYNTGTTSLVLPSTTYTKSILWVMFDGQYQNPALYSLADQTHLSYPSGVPAGVARIEVAYIAPLASAIVDDNSLTTAKFTAQSVTTPILADAAVTNAKLGAAVVTYDKMAINSILTGAIADGQVTTSKYAPASITYDKLGAVGPIQRFLDSPVTVTNVAGLVAIDKTLGPTICHTAGYYSAGDGGGGLFFLDPSDTTTANNGGTVIVANDGGRWKLFQNHDTSIKQWGAKADGTTDAYGVFVNALAAIPVGGAVRVNGGTFRISQAIVVPVGKAMYSQNLAYSASTTGTILLFDVAVPIMITVQGGGGGGQGSLKGITCQRGVGTVPSASIGILVGFNSQMTVIEDCYVFRSDYGFSIDGSSISANLGVKLIRCGTGQIYSRHVQLARSVETTFIACRFGRNGGGDYACTNFIAVVGTQVDTVHFIGCQFNQSGNSVSSFLQFYGYASDPNGIFTFSECHIESIASGGNIVSGDSSSTPIARLKFIASTINLTGNFLAVPAGVLSEFMLANCTCDGGVNLTLDQQVKSTLTGNHFDGGNILINAGSQNITGNSFDGSVTLQGASVKTVFVGNACGGLSNSMTGTAIIANNI